jgi:hypothetical protein
MKFKIHYDDQPNDGVDRLASILKKEFGITVTQLDGGDGFEEYEVIKDEDEKG